MGAAFVAALCIGAALVAAFGMSAAFVAALRIGAALVAAFGMSAALVAAFRIGAALIAAFPIGAALIAAFPIGTALIAGLAVRATWISAFVLIGTGTIALAMAENATHVVASTIDLSVTGNYLSGLTGYRATWQVARLQSFHAEYRFVLQTSRSRLLSFSTRKASDELRKPTVEGGTVHDFSRGSEIQNGYEYLQRPIAFPTHDTASR